MEHWGKTKVDQIVTSRLESVIYPMGNVHRTTYIPLKGQSLAPSFVRNGQLEESKQFGKRVGTMVV